MEPITMQILETTAKNIYSFLLKGVFSEIKRTLKEYNGSKLVTTQNEFEEAVIKELMETYKWASMDLFKNHNDNYDIYKRYVHLDLYLTPRRLHSSRNEIANKYNRKIKSYIFLNQIVHFSRTIQPLLCQPHILAV
jgi:hypothetical protein